MKDISGGVSYPLPGSCISTPTILAVFCAESITPSVSTSLTILPSIAFPNAPAPPPPKNSTFGIPQLSTFPV